MLIDKTCLQCGKAFRAKSTEVGKYCSKVCYRAYESVHGRPNDTIPVLFNCKVCGTEFQRMPGELRSYRKRFGKDPMYCSTKCGGLGRRYSDDMWRGTCMICGKPMQLQRRPGGTINQLPKLCSKECRGLLRSQTAKSGYAQGKPSRYINKQGYTQISVPAFITGTGKKQLVMEHRLVMEQMLGRPMLPEETVHHINGQRSDNRPENLSLRSSNHGPGGDVPGMLKWAHDFIALYPQFDREGNFTPVADPPPDAHAA